MANPTMPESPKTGIDTNLVNANLPNVRKLSMPVVLFWLTLILTKKVEDDREMERVFSVK